MPRSDWCACMTRMAADNANRSTERSVGVMCRMSPAEREELKHRAYAAGCTVQTYIIRMVFGRTDVQDLSPGRPIGSRRRPRPDMLAVGRSAEEVGEPPKTQRQFRDVQSMRWSGRRGPPVRREAGDARFVDELIALRDGVRALTTQADVAIRVATI